MSRRSSSHSCKGTLLAFGFRVRAGTRDAADRDHRAQGNGTRLVPMRAAFLPCRATGAGSAMRVPLALRHQLLVPLR